MTPLYWSEKSRDDRFSYRELDTLFSECDVIVNALAVNEETKKLFTQELLSKMHPTSYFISIAHIDHSLFIRLAEE